MLQHPARCLLSGLNSLFFFFSGGGSGGHLCIFPTSLLSSLGCAGGNFLSLWPYPACSSGSLGLARSSLWQLWTFTLRTASEELSSLSHFRGRRWQESSDVKYKIRLQLYHLILFPLNAKMWISLEAAWVLGHFSRSQRIPILEVSGLKKAKKMRS